MKSIFKITAIVAALAFSQSASASTDIYIVGSTAFRGGVATAVINKMGGDTACKIAHDGGAQTGSSLNGANNFLISGTFPGISGTTNVYAHWAGSTQGLDDLATSNGNPFIRTSSLPSSTGYANATATATPTGTTAPSLAFSDTFQSASHHTTPALNDTIVAVLPFVWVANRGTTGFSNVTAQQARAVLTASYQAKSLFTGDTTAADAGTYVMNVGRDDGSGTRATMLAETKYGIFQSLKQMLITTTGTAGTTATVTSAQLWPKDGSSFQNLAGNGGYSSGSFIKAIMGATSIPAGAYTGVEYYDENGADQGNLGQVTFISCLGAGDSAGAISSNGAVKLTYEGVDYYNGTTSAVPSQIYNGIYTMWGYEHLMTNGAPTGDLSTFTTALIPTFDTSTVLGSNGIKYSLMTVNRQTDGAVVGP